VKEFRISPIEIVALRKLELVSKAIATQLTSHTARTEQKCLADTLCDVLDRYQILEAGQPDEVGP
jgi:hypothetical protein